MSTFRVYGMTECKALQLARASYIEQAKRSPLARPLNHIADAGKMIGGDQHV
ncbi:hypothetical protein [Halomonas campaniensis]|uniref:hypothetical protein n=1 Tax=Halomonas campaniensis TaxID=213554 RepID=UPI001483BDBA|nr:hypothetical protein [Halomonas campaniensis]